MVKDGAGNTCIKAAAYYQADGVPELRYDMKYMTPEERRLRRKITGLSISQSHTSNALYIAGKGASSKQLREKRERVNQELAELRGQLQQLEQQRETTGRMPWPVLMAVNLTRRQFLDFWNCQYSGYDEDFYEQNIGQPLTAERIRMWFEWKNGGPLAAGKARSILRYSSPDERISVDADEGIAQEFLRRPGGSIWRIFWAHLQHPAQYPIYDQHVHRAMAYMRGWDRLEIPNDNTSKVTMYLDEYRPFFREFKDFPQRRVDRALWAFGKFVASEYVGVLGSRSSAGQKA